MTMLEVVIVLFLVALCSVMAIPRYAAFHDRLAARGAASLLTRALLDARHLAWRLGTRTAVRVDTAAASVTVQDAGGPIARHDLQSLFGVSVGATRDSVAYLPDGLGFGASNARFIVARGAAAETVTVSRIGRVRR
ncbi:MAG: type II secretion system protein [Cytophagaceae bacterium]|nr:type II secretion system protein [Gemmatimonadaceae bacterium]